MSYSDSELIAMISLLDDPDESVSRAVSKKLLGLPADEVPRLESVWESIKDQSQQSQLLDLIHRIQFYHVYHGLANWLETGAHDLLDGLLWVARYRYPNLTREEILQEVETIRTDVWIALDENPTIIEKIRTLNRIFYDKHGYSGNAKHYANPENSFINEVIRTKKGNPISMACLYSLVAQRLNMPVFGVNLPQHFVLAYLDDSEEFTLLKNSEKPVLFYINAFNNGVVFSRMEIDQFLTLLKLNSKEHFYKPCSNAEIIARFLNNLLNFYQENDQSRVNELELLRLLFKGE
jgi:regulator of sirC expression with transglutaminase-like and TPR domain